jgi:hypothetical protein
MLAIDKLNKTVQSVVATLENNEFAAALFVFCLFLCTLPRVKVRSLPTVSSYHVGWEALQRKSPLCYTYSARLLYTHVRYPARVISRG